MLNGRVTFEELTNDVLNSSCLGSTEVFSYSSLHKVTLYSDYPTLTELCISIDV